MMMVTDFLKYAFLWNQWLWFHILASGLAAIFLPFWVVVAAAFAWEIVEYLFQDIGKIYGSKFRFFADAFGDITGAIINALLIILF